MNQHDVSYDEAFATALARAEVVAKKMLGKAERARACHALLAASPSHQALLARNKPELGRAEVVLELIRRSEACRFDDADEMLRLSRAATNLALALPSSAAPTSILEDIRAQAWATLANAQRILGDLHAAEEAWRAADRHRAAGSGDPQLDAEAAWLKAMLRRRQERPEEAVTLLAAASSTFEEVGDQQAAAKARVTLGISHHELGNLAGAALQALRGGQLLDASAEPELMVGTMRNLVFYLHQAGWDLEAQRFLPRVKELIEARGQELEILRVRWLEAKIVGAAGQKTKARHLLDSVRLAFVEKGMAYDAALVSLELALMYAEAGFTGEVERLAAEMYPIFRSRELPQKTTAALLLFVQAVDRRSATPETIRQLLHQLETPATSQPS